MNIAAVMTVRNESDVLPVNVAYHRSVGVGEFWIIDNGSTDGTADWLATMAAKHEWMHWTSEPGAFNQSEFASYLAHEAHRTGADWVIPIDADEFWWSPERHLGSALDARGVGAYECELQNFVQASRVRHDHAGVLLTMKYRARPKGTPEDARRLVESGEIGFVEMAYPPKLILRPSQSLVIGRGNHTALGYNGSKESTTRIVVLHAAIRSLDRLAKLAEHGRRVAEVNPDPGTSWHLRRWSGMQDGGLLQEDWATNSYRRGKLKLKGRAHRLVRDNRLRAASMPFVSHLDRGLGLMRSVRP